MKKGRRWRRRRAPQPPRVKWLVVFCALAALSLSLVVAVPSFTLHGAGIELAHEGGIPDVWIDAPFINQRQKYPTGCESVTAVMALQYAGVDVSVETFIDQYLPQGKAPHYDEEGRFVGANPWNAFLGSPYSEEGWGCYAPVIAGAVEKLLEDRRVDNLAVQEMRGVELDELCRDYLDREIPVMLWATIGMEESRPSTEFLLEDTGESFTWLYPLHCLLLVGEDEGAYYFNDPMEEQGTSYSKEQVDRAYRGVGMQAVALVPQNGK